MNSEARILGPGQMEAPVGDIRYLFLPAADVFGRRAERLRTLAAGHSLAGYLLFLSRLAEAQQRVLQQPGPDWLKDLRAILETMPTAELPEAALGTIAALRRAPETELSPEADSILAGDLASIPPAELPFLAAALQVAWVRKASTLRERDVNRSEPKGTCPVCGSPPVAGMIRNGGAENGLRYLCCPLCASQWHSVRLTCSNCTTTEGLDYFSLEGSSGAVKAESCGQCGTYLKLMYLEKDGRMEPMADDLATLALDMLMNEAGKKRLGANLFLHPG